MILIIAEKFEKLRKLLLSGSRSKILERGLLQTTTEQCKSPVIPYVTF